MAARKIIIDTDPGQDDALAILLALGSPELDVLGITCVAGNVPLPLTIRNAQLVCELAGRRDIKIFAGCGRPMVRDLVTAEAVHGQTGLDGPDWDEPTMGVQDMHAVDWLVEVLMAAEDGEITLCPVGPITNVAMAMVREPRIIPKIAEIVTMGGGFFVGGNTTPVAEFNVYVDPHAADVMYRSGVPIVTMPLDVTHKALMSPEWIESVRAIGGDVGDKTAAMLSFYGRYDIEAVRRAGWAAPRSGHDRLPAESRPVRRQGCVRRRGDAFRAHHGHDRRGLLEPVGAAPQLQVDQRGRQRRLLHPDPGAAHEP